MAPDFQDSDYDAPQTAQQEPEQVADSAVDATRNRKLRETAKDKERTIHKFWNDAMSTREGRRAVWELLEQAATFKPIFGVGPNGMPQPDVTMYNLGQRDFGIRFYQARMLHSPQQVVLMHQENDIQFSKGKGS